MPDTNIAERSIDSEIAAYNGMKGDLEEHHMGKFVVVYGSKLRGSFDTLENAAVFARAHFHTGPYLIREVGATFSPLPASVMFRSAAHA